MDFIDYREKLGIGFYDEELEKLFFNRLFNILDYALSRIGQISVEEYFDFCQKTGIRAVNNPRNDNCWEIVMNILRGKSSSLKKFLPYYMFFINTQEDNEYKAYSKEEFKNLTCECLQESHIPYDILEDKGNYFIFPKGVAEFDKALVSETLLWLNEYPETQKAWVNALKSYSMADETTASETADNFRKALERFFQEFFNTTKSIENLKSEYGSFLASKGVPAEIRNNLQKILELYALFNNNNAKHHDKTNKNVLEFIMYQTGSLIRLLISLNKDWNIINVYVKVNILKKHPSRDRCFF